MIIDTIMRAYPDHGIVGEERGAANEDAEFVWIIDPPRRHFELPRRHPPISAFRSGSGGVPCSSTGVIVDPVRNEEFSATRGAGARLNGMRLRVSERPRLENAIIATGIPYRMVESHLDGYLEMHRALQASCRSIRRMGAAALDLAYVGAGRTDAFVQVGLQPWDMAAGTVIVREAGGFVSDAAGGDRFMENGHLVAANPRIFKDLLRLVHVSVGKDLASS